MSALLKRGWSGSGLPDLRFLGQAGGQQLLRDSVALGATRRPPCIDPAPLPSHPPSPPLAPARVALWVTRGRQVTANGGGLLTRVARRRSRAAGGASRSRAGGRYTLHSGLRFTGGTRLEASWTGRWRRQPRRRRAARALGARVQGRQRAGDPLGLWGALRPAPGSPAWRP